MRSSYSSHPQATVPNYLVLYMKQSNKNSLTQLFCIHPHLHLCMIPWLYYSHAILVMICSCSPGTTSIWCCSSISFSWLCSPISACTCPPPTCLLLPHDFSGVFHPSVPLRMWLWELRNAPRCFMLPLRWQHLPPLLQVAEVKSSATTTSEHQVLHITFQNFLPYTLHLALLTGPHKFLAHSYDKVLLLPRIPKRLF